MEFLGGERRYKAYGDRYTSKNRNQKRRPATKPYSL